MTELVEDVKALEAVQPPDRQAAIYAALAKAQAKFPPIDRNRSQEKPFKFSWASWDHVLELLRKPLAENGLAFVQPFEIDDGMLILRSMIVHKDGGVLESRLPLRTSGLTDQQSGSHFTYMKRYAGCALLGIAAEEDDDGTASSDEQAEKQAKRIPSTKQKDGLISDAQRARLFAIAKEAAVSEEQLRDIVKSHTGDPSTSTIQVGQYDLIVAEVQAMQVPF